MLRTTLSFTLIALCLAMFNTSYGHAEHDSLAPHEHGIATLSLAQDGQVLEIKLDTPASNLLGFEHAAKTPADKSQLVQTETQLRKPIELFGIPSAAACSVGQTRLVSPLFEQAEHANHSDIEASYQLTCSHPERLKTIDLNGFFKQFPLTNQITVQSVSETGQNVFEATASNAQPSL